MDWFFDLLHVTAKKIQTPHRTTSENGQNATVWLPPPWRMLAITRPKIMLQKMWCCSRAQRFDRSRASPPDSSCFCSITSSSSWILMIWWMQYSTINKNPFAHGTRGWDWLVRWRGSMEWSNSKKEPTENWINHGRLEATINYCNCFHCRRDFSFS